MLAGRGGEDRTIDQLRADILRDVLLDGDSKRLPKRLRGIRPTVVVTVPVLSLLSGDDAAPTGPAVVEGIGPIPLRRARELCGAATGWMRVLTHPETGAVLSVGRKSYRPPPSLRRLVRWRADRCMAPGCGVPASRCDLDHSIPWEHGGDTASHNLCPLCRGHHVVKHHGGWSVALHDDGAVEWASPLGRRYRVDPERSLRFGTTSVPDIVPF